MKNDAARLYQAFVRVWAVVALIALPSAVGVACLADPMIRVVLGSQWTQAAALVTPLAAIGVLQALHGCYWPMLLARRGPRSVFMLSALGATLTLPVFVLLLWRLGLLAAIVGTVVCGIIMLFAGAWLLLHDLRGRAAPLFAALARPALGSAAMAASIMALRGQIDFGVSWIGQLLALIVLVGLGAFVYFAVVTLLWSAIGRPDSAERELITMAKSAIRRRSPREEQG
jgi:O-antigen/teichoic acid export membrane protein